MIRSWSSQYENYAKLREKLSIIWLIISIWGIISDIFLYFCCLDMERGHFNGK